ncbi:type IV toxin-antitoxin system AbiEi family antitoxin [Xanthomonas campestris pv. phormiicola]|nr:type IV toxin-antitoxin system AbiEi family antitoxin [Xanthomonas campestris pv. phormiicola]
MIKVLEIEREMLTPDHRTIDIVARIEASGRLHTLFCEVKSSGQPRNVRLALLQLRHLMANQANETTPVFIAPYLSPEAQALCLEQGVGYLDLEGNARLTFDSVFIDRKVASKPVVERREIRSLFKPKSAQVLRVMLRDPRRAWRVTELAEVADVSLGHVSNVRVGLLNREWAQVSREGLFLSEPDALVDAWRDAYVAPAGHRLSFYTTLHGHSFEEATRRLLRSEPAPGRLALASFSAAHWLAPYARTGTQYFYSDEAGLEQLRSGLRLSSTSKGENVTVTLLKDLGVFRDTVEPAPGVICTGPVQTYLDLAAAGERGREAADHLRRERLTWQK